MTALRYTVVDRHNTLEKWNFLARFEDVSDAIWYAKNVARARELRESNTTIYVVNIHDYTRLATFGKRTELTNLQLQGMLYADTRNRT